MTTPPRAAEPGRAGPLGRLGGAVGARPVVAIAVWTVLVVIAVATALAGAGGQNLFDRLQNGAPSVTGEASHADDLLAGTGAATESVTLLVNGVTLDDPRLLLWANRLGASLGTLPHTEFVDPLALPSLPGGGHPQAIASAFSSDDRGVLLTATVSGVGSGDPDSATVDRAATELRHAATQLTPENSTVRPARSAVRRIASRRMPRRSSSLRCHDSPMAARAERYSSRKRLTTSSP